MAGLNSFDLVQTTFIGKLFEQEVLNVFYYRIGTPSTSSNYMVAIKNWAQYAGSGTTSMAPVLLACQAPEYTLMGIRAQRVWPTRDRYYYQVLDLPGTHADACTSPNQSAVIERYSAGGNRKSVGSTHIPGVPSTAMDEGRWTAGYRTLLQAVADRMLIDHITTLETTEGHLEITGKTSMGVTNPVVGSIVKDTVRVMRRRTIGVGR